MLSETIPTPDLVGLKTRIYADLANKWQNNFVYCLWYLYIIDIVFIVLNLLRGWQKIHPRAREALAIWLVLNLICLACLYYLPLTEKSLHSNIASQPVNKIALYLAFLHGVRFLLDLGLTFEFYYPGGKSLISLGKRATIGAG